MNKSIIKSIVLGMLIVGSIYQIVTLWFDNVSDRNVFYSFIEKAKDYISQPQISGDKAYLVTPRFIGVYLNTSAVDYTVINRTSSEYNDIFNETIIAVTKVLDKGTPLEASPEDIDLWLSRSIVLPLAFSLSRETLASDLGINKVMIKPESVNFIGIIPANDKGDTIKVFLIGQNTSEITMYSLSASTLEESNAKLIEYMEKLDDQGIPSYDSTLRNELDLFVNNILLPRRSESNQYTKQVSFSAPFITDGVFNSNLEVYVDHFFVNPDVVKATYEDDNSVRFDYDNITIKYSQEGILEYTSIENGTVSNQSLSEAYSVAVRFLKKDTLLSQTDYYLMGFEKNNNKSTFYYGYLYDNLPINMQDALITGKKLDYPMAVTVSEGKVIDFKRILLEQDNLTPRSVQVNYVAVLDQFVTDFMAKEGTIEDMYLGYYKEGKSAKLMWMIKYNGQYYKQDLEYGE